MNEIPDGKESATAKVARELAQLQAQAEEERATLTRLQQAVVEAKNRPDSNQETQLVEANERLVLAALLAQTDAEAATRTLNEVSRAAELDTLTGLPNRVLLLDRFARAIASAKRRGSRLALMFLDLNDFKQINDTLGHAAGDEVLKLVAHRLASAVREADTVSRHGGDEFVILLTDVPQASVAGRIAGKVIAALGAPGRVGDHELHLAASIGISIYPDDGEDIDELMIRADAAMYRAKRRGFGGFVFHGEEPRGERILKSPAPASTQGPLTRELTLAEHERRHAQLREANEQLVLAAVSAQELKSAVELSQQRQTEFLATLARELSSPLAPIRDAAEMLGRVHLDAVRVSEVRAVIEQQVTHMSRLVGELLDV